MPKLQGARGICDKVSTLAGYLTLVKFHLLLENSDRLIGAITDSSLETILGVGST